MTEQDKKVRQTRRRLSEVEARDRKKEQKARTQRLIREGAILEKVFPEARTMEMDMLRTVLEERLGIKNDD